MNCKKSLLFIFVITLVGSLLTSYINNRALNLITPDYFIYKKDIIKKNEYNKPSHLYFQIDSKDIEFIVTNDIGEKTGYDFSLETFFNEIKNSSYYKEAMGEYSATEDQVVWYKFVSITNSNSTYYFIKVFGLKNTDYSLYVSSDTASGGENSQISSTIKKGETQEFVAELMPDGQVAIERK